MKKTMLTVAAAVLAISSLAFASDSGHGRGQETHGKFEPPSADGPKGGQETHGFKPAFPRGCADESGTPGYNSVQGLSKAEVIEMLQETKEAVCLNLEGRDLSNADLSGVTFEWSLLSGANLAGTKLKKARFEGADLYAATLEATNAAGAVFQESNLGFVNLRGARLNSAVFVRTSLIGTSEALSAGDQSGVEKADFRGARFDRSRLPESLPGAIYDATTRFPDRMREAPRGMIFQPTGVARSEKKD